MKYFKHATLIICLAAGTASAYDFSEANRFYNNREDSPHNLKQAEDRYQAALNQSSGADLLYAVEQLGRIYYYWGDLLTPDNDDNARKDIFGRCRNMVEKVRPSKVGENAQYYYWKASCLALWGKSASLWEKVRLKDELVSTLEQGFNHSGSYEGGGIHRVAAGVYIRSANIPFVGLYDENKAMEHINKAISMDQDNLYYNAYLLKAEVLVAQGKNDEAQGLLEDKSFELSRKLANNSLPSAVVPESKVFSREIASMMSKL